MNNARMWLVVNPTVGLPVFFGAIALVALANHAAVLTHSTWFTKFIEGGQKKTALETTTPRGSDTAAVVPSAPAQVVFNSQAQAQEVTITLQDGRRIRGVIEAPAEQTALVTPR